MGDTVRISLDIATQAADIALRNIKKTTEEVDKTFSIFKGNFAAGLALDGVRTAFDKLTGFVSTLIDEASASEKAIQSLNIALKSTGLYTPVASKNMQEFADALQKNSIYSHEAVLSSQALLLSLTALDADGVQAATQAAADLAATLGVDLGTATSMIEKAVNGNTRAFKKIGIEIQSATTDSARLDNVLKALSSQHGAASAATETFAGSMAKAKNQQNETYAALGKLITQNPAVVAGIKAMSTAFIESAEFITNNSKFISDLAITIGLTAGIAVTAWAVYSSATLAALAATVLTSASIIASLGAVSGSFVLLQTIAGTAWAIVTAPVTLVIGAIALVGIAIYQLVKNWDTVKAATYDALAATLDFASKGLAVFSTDKANALRAQATAFREQATSIRVAAAAAKEKAAQDAANDKQSDEQREKRKETFS